MEMVKDSIKTAMLAAFVVCAGFAGAQAYEQFTNASVAMANGKLANMDSLASAYCTSKGFQGAEKYEFSGFMSNGGQANAVFASIRCTMVAGVQPTGNVAKGKTAGGVNLIYNPDAVKTINQAIKTEKVKNAISNSISNHYQVSSTPHVSSPGGGSIFH
jgi:hypothetical protein